MTASHAITPARLALADGTVLHGRAFGAADSALTSAGEVVFNTAMCGYQEALSDPSYAGQILVMTAPMIGNYGVAPEDVESSRVQVAGLVVRELSRIRSNFRSHMHLADWLANEGVLGIEGIDTRALVRRLRTAGVMPGVISCDAGKSDAELVEIARNAPEMSGRNLVKDLNHGGTETRRIGGSEGGGVEIPQPSHLRASVSPGLKVVALDCGAKENIYRNLAERGCEIHAVPFDTPADEIRRMNPDGLFISNGPGDPAAVDATIATLREIAGEVPTFGICLGHQLLALALGAKTYKLKFGHRGANQPVRNLLTGKVEITSQNHGFCVDADSLRAAGCEPTHIHLNDGTVAGFRHREKPILAVQHHPEASPGPHDAGYLFDCFTKMMRSGRPIDADMLRDAQEKQRSVGYR